MKAAVAEAACHRSAADADILAIGLLRPVILLLFRWKSRNIRGLTLILLPPRARGAGVRVARVRAIQPEGESHLFVACIIR